MLKRILSLAIIFCFFMTTLTPYPQAHADSVLNLPAPGTMINLSPAYEPVIIKGLTIHKDNPFLFDFIVDVGQDKMSGEPLKKEGEKLIKYFLASLAIPDQDLWVNLSPYEKTRMIPNALGQTDMGRDLLEQDYILKQITASLIYPEKQLGKTFWDRVYAKAQQMYGTTQVPVDTFNKVWITADQAAIFEHHQTAFVVRQHLKVMLEEDYLALQKHSSGVVANLKGEAISKRTSKNTLASQIVRQIILPEIEKEVNTGKNFANLRQIFNSIILSSWYKKNLKEALLNQVYANKSQVKGINLNDPTIKERIYEQYLKAYKKGVFNYIKEDVNAAGAMMPRKYFSGGVWVPGAATNPAIDDSTTDLDRAMTTNPLIKFAMLASTQRAMSPSKSTNAAMTAPLSIGITEMEWRKNHTHGELEARMRRVFEQLEKKYTFGLGLSAKFHPTALKIIESDLMSPHAPLGADQKVIDEIIRQSYDTTSKLNAKIMLEEARELWAESRDAAMLNFRKDEKVGDIQSAYRDVLNPKVLDVLEHVVPLNEKLVELRVKQDETYVERQTQGKKIGFLPIFNPDGTKALIPGSNIPVEAARNGNFIGDAVPADLQRQWIQLTGPIAKSPQDIPAGLSDREILKRHLRNAFYALTSGADGMMFDGEDALGQLGTMSLDNTRALVEAYEKTPLFWEVADELSKDMIKKGKKLPDNWRELIEDNFTARLYRPRGLHLDDRHINFINSEGKETALSASIVDTVTYLVNAGPVLLEQGSTPTLYLPKLQTAEQAAWWASLIDTIEDQMGWKRGTVKVFVLIEQLEESFQLMEIRAVLGKHFVGFNTGRWDYIADVVKQNMWDNNFVPPNFIEMTMTYPFMHNYEGRVWNAVNTPDKRGNKVLWIGGMEPQIPVVKGNISAADKEKAIQGAMQIAKASKLRELRRGASGTWVAHPGMVEELRKVYEVNLFDPTGGKVNQIGITQNLNGETIEPLKYDQQAADALTELKPGARTIAEVRFLVSVAMQYVNADLTGRAAAALKGADLFIDPSKLFIMEDMATGEGRSKLTMKWMIANAPITQVTDEDRQSLGIDTGAHFTPALIQTIVDQEYAKLQNASDDIVFASSKTKELPIAHMIVEKFLFSKTPVPLPWLVDLVNIALGAKDLQDATAKVDHFIEVFNQSGGMTRITSNPLFANAAMTATPGALLLQSAPEPLKAGILATIDRILNGDGVSRTAQATLFVERSLKEDGIHPIFGDPQKDLSEGLLLRIIVEGQDGPEILNDKLRYYQTVLGESNAAMSAEEQATRKNNPTLLGALDIKMLKKRWEFTSQERAEWQQRLEAIKASLKAQKPNGFNNEIKNTRYAQSDITLISGTLAIQAIVDYITSEFSDVGLTGGKPLQLRGRGLVASYLADPNKVPRKDTIAEITQVFSLASGVPSYRVSDMLDHGIELLGGVERKALDWAMRAGDMAVVTHVGTDTPLGGIDLNTSNGMQWKISKDGNGVEMNIDPAMVARIKREGINSLTPIIYRMTPVASIWPIIGLEQPQREELLAKV